MSQESLRQRVENHLYQGRRKPWYRRWQGISVITAVAFFIIAIIIFIFFVNFYYQKISSGDLLSQAVGSIKQQAKLDLLQNVNDPFLGPELADITVVAFEDFSCPFCLQAQPFIKKLVAKYPDRLKFIYKDFPLNEIHPKAQSAAEAAQCAFEQGKFWVYHDALFADQEAYSDDHYRGLAKDLGLNLTQFNACYNTHKYAQSIATDVDLGQSLGVRGTPTWFVNGEFVAEGYGPGMENVFDSIVEYISGL